ncbi:MAG: GntP family permease, partial [Bacillota bacterium]|nr:GntP family permease [Bacillota bacterium]
IAAALFREAGIPKRLIPATIALSSFTFTMAALPGTAQIQNAIPMPFYGTDTYAGPILGIVAAIIMFSFGMWWITSRAKKAMAKGEGYGEHKETFADFDESTLPSFGFALIPILIVLIMNFCLTNFYFKHMDAKWLSGAPYNTTLSKVAGTWSLILSLIVAIITVIIINRKRFAGIVKSVNSGAIGSLLAVINTSSEVGYGNVVATLAGFVIIKTAILGISSNPLISSAISVNLLAGMTGSASGGMSIALGALGKTYLDMAHTMGIDPGALHRITVLACSGLDALPHNGAVITLLGITGLTHKQSYKDIFMVCSVGTLFAVIAAVSLALLGVV